MIHNKKKIFGAALIFLFLFVSFHVGAMTQPEVTKQGKESFYLVSMGPGDPDLATVRAMTIIGKTDLIICSQSLAERFNSVLTGKEVMTIPASLSIGHGYGKNEKDYQGCELEKFRKSKKTRGQLITKIRGAIKHGKIVAVLDSGDPLIYGGWVWCLEEFQDLDPVVVAGVSRFNAANAALKKDITYSDTCKSIIITADDQLGKRDTIKELAGNQATMIISTMGFDLKKLAGKLMTHYPSQTPVAIVCYAGHKEKECVIKGTLGTILKKTLNIGLPFEHLVFVGKNVNFRWKKESGSVLQVGCKGSMTKEDDPAGSRKENLYLVGMGPGDPDLATIRAMKIVEEADLIICQFKSIVNERFSQVLKDKEVWGPPEHVWTWHGYGKKASDFQGKELEKFQTCEKTRGEIIAKIRQAIKDGKTVAILEHGDPLIYGPWSWTLEEFSDLRPIVVPGVSSFNAANAALKRDVTSGKNTKSVIITVPDAPDWLERAAFDMDKVARHQVTMVIFMPSYNTELKNLVAELSAYYPRETPIALVVCAGFKEKERIIRGTLDNMVEKVKNEKLPFEHLMYVGDFLTHEMKGEQK
jgi:precorrin-4 methylase